MADQIPEEAIKAAAEAISRELNSGDIYQTHVEHDEHLARLALEAAVPAIREAEREQMRKGLHDLIMGPVWQWCISMVPEAKTTYGVDAVGKCAELVQQWPDIDPEALARIDHGDRIGVVVADAVRAERERWRAILADHYLTGINCDPETKRDNPLCNCSRVFLGWHPSVGAARDAWIGHVTELLERP